MAVEVREAADGVLVAGGVGEGGGGGGGGGGGRPSCLTLTGSGQPPVGRPRLVPRCSVSSMVGSFREVWFVGYFGASGWRQARHSKWGS